MDLQSASYPIIILYVCVCVCKWEQVIGWQQLERGEYSCRRRGDERRKRERRGENGREETLGHV